MSERQSISPSPEGHAGGHSSHGSHHTKHDKLLETVRRMNAASAQASLANSSSANSFHFYDTQQINDFADQIEDVLFRISKNKVDKEQIHRSMRRTKSVELLKATRSERLLMSKPVKHSRPWDRSPHISHELMETLRAPVETDASTSVYSPHRDLPRTKEGQAKMAGETLASFKPGEIGKMFGEPPIDSCADTYQEMLLRHLLRSVERIEQEYNAMPWATVATTSPVAGLRLSYVSPLAAPQYSPSMKSLRSRMVTLSRLGG